jgi:hypothetical protein
MVLLLDLTVATTADGIPYPESGTQKIIYYSFADLAANVFIRNGIKVYIFSEVVPTPVLVRIIL